MTHSNCFSKVKMQSEIRQMKDRLKQDFAREVFEKKKLIPCFCYGKVISSQVSTLEEEIEELRRKFEASKKSRSSKSDSFGHFDEGRGSRYVLLCQDGWWGCKHSLKIARPLWDEEVSYNLSEVWSCLHSTLQPSILEETIKHRSPNFYFNKYF